MRALTHSTRSVLAAVWLAVASVAGCSTAPEARDASTPTEVSGAGREVRLLDGRAKSFVIVGYSTSYAWPAMLQDMLDEHAGGRRIYHVLNAVAGGAPVEHWVAEPGDRNFERTIGAMRVDFFGAAPRLRGAAPEPTIALCQQSLQFTFDRRGPVKTESDMVGAELGADRLEALSLRLRDLGIEEVHIAMHIYKEPVEPEVGNERIALARLLRRGHDFVRGGPDVWIPTRACYPDCFEDDGLHPNLTGTKLMAEHWYRHVAGSDARDSVIAALHARDYDYREMMREYLAWRRGE
jgi:hypothetical protein